jgi:sialate O-acetylesterase
LLRLDEPGEAVDNGGPILGFAVAGKDRKFHPAEASHLIIGEDDRGRPKKDTKVIVLRSPMVTEPIHYRYAWARSPLGNLQASRNVDIPFATQRSDDWSLENAPSGLFEEVTGKLDRRQRRIQQEALRQLDLDRRVRAAQSLIESAKSQ